MVIAKDFSTNNISQAQMTDIIEDEKKEKGKNKDSIFQVIRFDLMFSSDKSQSTSTYQ